MTPQQEKAEAVKDLAGSLNQAIMDAHHAGVQVVVYVQSHQLIMHGTTEIPIVTVQCSVRL